jgi:hypothetical protein
MNILLHFVNSVINREHSVIVYVFFASWSNTWTYFIFLRYIQTQLLALLLHLPHVSVSNVCWRLLTFLSYYRQILCSSLLKPRLFHIADNSPFQITLTLSFPQSIIDSVIQWKFTNWRIKFFMAHSQSEKYIEKLLCFEILVLQASLKLCICEERYWSLKAFDDLNFHCHIKLH